MRGRVGEKERWGRREEGSERDIGVWFWGVFFEWNTGQDRRRGKGERGQPPHIHLVVAHGVEVGQQQRHRQEVPPGVDQDGPERKAWEVGYALLGDRIVWPEALPGVCASRMK